MAGHDKDHALDSCDDHTACSDCTDRDCDTSKHGLMPKADKIKLDAIDAGAEVNMTQAFIALYRTDAFNMAANNTWYDLPWNIASPCKKNVTHDHTSNPEQITLTLGGTYKFAWDLNFSENIPALTRPFCVTRLLDDATEIPGTYRLGDAYTGYISRISGSWIGFIAANSLIELQVGTAVATTDVKSAVWNEPTPTTRCCATISIHKISDDTS